MVTIKVTNKCLKQGRKGLAQECPVFLAVRSLLSKNVICLVVTRHRVCIQDETGKWHSFNFNQDIRNKIRDYDLERSIITPFSFELDIPKELLV